jgi:hypothetical protein
VDLVVLRLDAGRHPGTTVKATRLGPAFSVFVLAVRLSR